MVCSRLGLQRLFLAWAGTILEAVLVLSMVADLCLILLLRGGTEQALVPSTINTILQ